VTGISLVRAAGETHASQSEPLWLSSTNSPNFASLHWMFVINIKYNGATARNYDLR
jgi:hypothetical protein